MKAKKQRKKEKKKNYYDRWEGQFVLSNLGDWFELELDGGWGLRVTPCRPKFPNAGWPIKMIY